MKIATRIISGYGLLLAALAGLVIHQVVTIRHMMATSRTLSGINFQSAVNCLQAFRDLDRVDDYTRKLIVKRGDPDYLKALQESRENFQRGLETLKNRANSDEEEPAVNNLSRQWDSYSRHLGLLQEKLSKGETELPREIEEDLDNLNTLVNSLYHATLQTMASKVEASTKAGETAELILWGATFVALAISILVSFLIVRSISKPLALLTEGTRAIADGKFFYRLDTTRKDEFAQLARDFNKMTLRLNELDELKKGFVSHVSHELKAPLASMQETIQIMLEEIPGPLTEKQKRLLTLNLQSGNRLTSMISNLLDVSKTEAGVMEYALKNQDLVPLVRNAIAELEVQAQEKQIQINAALPDKPLLAECDSDRVVQVVFNLIGNAVKFSPKNSVVYVRLEKTQQIPPTVPSRWLRFITDPGENGYFALIAVEDSGPGIPDEDKEKIFEKFHQVKQRKKLAGQGAGLGLSISRTIIQAHRGAIWVENNSGAGSRFLVLLRHGESSDEVVSRASMPI